MVKNPPPGFCFSTDRKKFALAESLISHDRSHATPQETPAEPEALPSCLVLVRFYSNDVGARSLVTDLSPNPPLLDILGSA